MKMSFLTEIYSCSGYTATLLRLTKMIRGIGNPLVAVYARCYLCRMGISLDVNSVNYFVENFSDFLDGYRNLIGRNIKHISKQSINISDYMQLYVPSLTFITQAAAHNAPESLLNQLLNKCRKQSN